MSFGRNLQAVCPVVIVLGEYEIDLADVPGDRIALDSSDEGSSDVILDVEYM